LPNSIEVTLSDASLSTLASRAAINRRLLSAFHREGAISICTALPKPSLTVAALRFTIQRVDDTIKTCEADVAQLVEQPIRNRQVSGSSPLVGSSAIAIPPSGHKSCPKFTRTTSGTGLSTVFYGVAIATGRVPAHNRDRSAGATGFLRVHNCDPILPTGRSTNTSHPRPAASLMGAGRIASFQRFLHISGSGSVAEAS
jgi:hypothetical protein